MSVYPPVTNLEYLQSLLTKHTITPQREHGQSFLIAPEVVEATMTAAAEGPGNVTELGAGVGPLTQALAAAGHTIRAIENDRVLADLLPQQLPPAARARVTVVPQDLRTVAWEWETPYQVIGNIPYNLSGLIIRRLPQLTPPPTQAILLVQQEVAQRLLATAPHLHLIGLAAQLWAGVHELVQVPADCFWPRPAVHSTLLLFLPHRDALPLATREGIIQLAKPLFQAKRKQLLGTLSRTLKQPRAQIAEVLAAIGIVPTARPQEVTLSQWHQLYTIIQAPRVAEAAGE